MTTHSDIIVEMLSHERGSAKEAWYTPKSWRDLCERLETAHMHEVVAAMQFTRAKVTVHEVPRGNGAVLCKALKRCYKALKGVDEKLPVSDNQIRILVDKVGLTERLLDDCKAALKSRPRNCDRYNSGDPVKDADDAYAEWQRQCDALGIPPSCKVESAFRQWVFRRGR